MHSLKFLASLGSRVRRRHRKAAGRHPLAVHRLHSWHTLSAEATLGALKSSRTGLSQGEAAERLLRVGPNRLPETPPPGIVVLFVRQFRNPFIYVLLGASAVASAMAEWLDAAFIGAVLLLNAVIGTVQELHAQNSAGALRRLLVSRVTVIRDDESHEVASTDLVPGDVVALESGMRIPADMRLLQSEGVEIDESALTGESQPVVKQAQALHPRDTVLAERSNMAFAGTMVTHGRATGVITATGRYTELGDVAASLSGITSPKPPLLQRMERFTYQLGLALAGIIVFITAAQFAHGAAPADLLLAALALAVSAIPEGLPVALTVALAVSVNRMARRGVVVRRLVAIEALGSCTVIATDKTGTLTVNELTARRLAFPGADQVWEVSGEGSDVDGYVTALNHEATDLDRRLVDRLCRVGVLCNEGYLGRRDGDWVHHGDPVDVALLVLAEKAGLSRVDIASSLPLLSRIAYEPERGYAATLHRDEDPAGRSQGRCLVCVKGAPERVVPMCAQVAVSDGSVDLDFAQVDATVASLARAGFRVIAFADALVERDPGHVLSDSELRNLTLIGLVGIIDPARPEAKAAIAACRKAGLRICVVTGDHAETAAAVAMDVGIDGENPAILTGAQLRMLAPERDVALWSQIQRTDVFARVEPRQKLDIVRALQNAGEFVAVTGDGINDAPALANAHVGVAMGQRGTDVARENADIVLTDDNFSSLAAGIEEGRIAYQNIRKVIFLLISTGAAEIVLFLLASLTGMPLPLTAVQLLWLNLVTNGVQDVALAFDPAEGGEMERGPRPPQQPIFDPLMVQRVVLSALVMGVLGFLAFRWLLDHGWDEAAARNLLLLLMVLFENVQAFNSRSETRSILLNQSPFRNPLLFYGIVAALVIHVSTLYAPPLQWVLQTAPVAPRGWLLLIGLALVLLIVVEAEKWARAHHLRRRR